MTYNIDWKSNNAESIPGKAPIILAERTVDTTSTSLALTGKGTANYGEMQQENFIRLLENFASNTAPPNPTVGQLWFHPVDKALYLCVQTSTVVANTAVYYQSGVIGWVRVWESTELGTIVGDLEQSIVDAITAHINAADPHPQYLTLAEGNLQYLQKTGGTLTGPLVLPSDASSALQAVPKQQLDAAITTHTNAADPHPQYLTQTEADGRYSLGTGTVNLTGDQTIAGTKTFSSTITGSVSGNAGTVTNGVYTSGDQTIGGVKTFSASPEIVNSSESSIRISKAGTNASVTKLFNSQDSYGISDNTYGELITKNKSTGRMSAGGVDFGGNADELIGNIYIGNSATLSFGNNHKHNIAIGVNALENVASNTPVAIGDATNNIAVGRNSLQENLTGHENIAIGGFALSKNTTGTANIAIGYAANSYGVLGSGNISIGDFTMSFISTDSNNNTAIGGDAFTGFGSIVNNSSALGANSDVTGSNQVQLGDSGTTTYVFGTVQNRSDLRDKADVRDTQLGLNFINALRPVDYKWDMREYYKTKPPIKPEKPSPNATPEELSAYETALEKIETDITRWIENNSYSAIQKDGSKKRSRYHHGVIAQEVKDAMDELGVDFGGYQDHKIAGGEDVLSVGYDEFIAPLIKAVQELSAKVAELEKQLKT